MTTEPRTEAGKRLLGRLWRPRPDLEEDVLAIESEAVRTALDALAKDWETAKLTKGSVMQDVGGVIEIVDALILSATQEEAGR